MRSPFRHLLWLLVPLHACNDPTYVTVHVTTDVPCERLQGVSLTFGTLGTLEDKVPTTRTALCNGGEIGTLTVVPSGGDDGEFGVRVIMGIDRDVESCTSPAYGDGCVVARRGLRFLPGESVELPIVMRQICNGIPCGPYDTCVRGTCVPATCKDSNGCTEDKLVENATSTGDGGLDGPPGDAPVLGPDREPPEILDAYCGASGVLDRNAAWPIRRGCLSRAGVTRFHGPIEQGLVVEGIVNTAWTALVVDDTERAWGVTQSQASLVTFAKPAAVSESIGYQPPAASAPFAPALLTDVVLYPHQTGISRVVRDPQSPGFPRGDYSATGGFDGGFETFLGAWVPQREGAAPPSMLIVRDGSGYTPASWKLRRVVLTDPPSFTATTDIAGTKFSDPAVSPNGTTLYIASDQSVSAFDPKTGSSKWSVPAETARVGLSDRSQNFDTLVLVRPDGAATGDWVLRTYSPTGPFAGADVPILKDAPAQAIIDWSMALALVPGNDIAVVTDGRDVIGIDLTTRAEIWRQPNLNTGARVQFVSTPGAIYVAGSARLTAISPADGAILFTSSAPWGPVSDLAIGPNHTLYVSEQVLLYRAGPRL